MNNVNGTKGRVEGGPTRMEAIADAAAHYGMELWQECNAKRTYIFWAWVTWSQYLDNRGANPPYSPDGCVLGYPTETHYLNTRPKNSSSLTNLRPATCDLFGKEQLASALSPYL